MRLYLFRVGAVRDNGVPITCALIRTDDDTFVLVDTGAPAEMTGDPEAPFAVAPGEDVVSRLRDLGLTPGDIGIVVITHLDPDHCGHNDAFPASRIVVQEANLAAARTSGEMRYEWQRAHWDAPGLRYETVDGDHELLPGVHLVASPGHAPGHQSVLVHLPRTGPVLIAGDAIAAADQTDPETRFVGMFDDDEPAVRASTRRLMDLGAALIVHAHDADQWSGSPSGLRLAPGYYD